MFSNSTLRLLLEEVSAHHEYQIRDQMIFILAISFSLYLGTYFIN